MRILCLVWFLSYFYMLAFYLVASYSDPGYINIMWLEDVKKYPEFKEGLDDNGEKCFCENCNMPRPLRAHHCTACKKCVLLMDHHCDFIGNCVGYRNFRAFVMFMITFWIHSFLTFTVIVSAVVQSEDSPPRIIVCVFGGLYFGLFGSLVSCQLVAQLQFLVRNTTWIESEGSRVRGAIYKKANVQNVNRFDIGPVKNMKQRLGQSPWSWLVPGLNPGNPYVFPENPNFVGIWELNHINVEEDENGLLPGARLRSQFRL